MALPLLLRAFPLAAGPLDTDGRATIVISEHPKGAVGAGQPAFLADGTMNPLLNRKKRMHCGCTRRRVMKALPRSGILRLRRFRGMAA